MAKKSNKQLGSTAIATPTVMAMSPGGLEGTMGVKGIAHGDSYNAPHQSKIDSVRKARNSGSEADPVSNR